MKEDNNIKSLIASILKLSLKLSKCNASAKDCPKAKDKPKAKPKDKAKDKPKDKAKDKPKDKAKAKANVPTKKGRRTRIVGGGSAEFFE
jgi:hypothetical protein